jgi:hypothetical protein
MEQLPQSNSEKVNLFFRIDLCALIIYSSGERSDWEEREDIILMESVLVNGKRWSQISEIIGCRSES